MGLPGTSAKSKHPDEFEGLCDDEPGEQMNMRMLNGWVQTHQLAGKVIPESIQGGVASLQELEVDFSQTTD
jgi:hypothetical protein